MLCRANCLVRAAAATIEIPERAMATVDLSRDDARVFRRRRIHAIGCDGWLGATEGTAHVCLDIVGTTVQRKAQIACGDVESDGKWADVLADCQRIGIMVKTTL